MYYIKIPIGECKFATAGKYVARHRPTHSRRTLNTTVLLVGRSGECPISEDGREYILREGDFLMLAEGKEHFGTAPVSEGQSHYWCHFTQPSGWELVTSDTEPEPTDGYYFLPEFGHIGDFERIRMLFHQLIDSSCRDYTDESVRVAVCSDYVRIILCELAEECARSAKERGILTKKTSALAAKVREYIELHATYGGLSVTQLAQLFHYNSNYLAQTFKSETGETVSAYASRVRVREAAKLLMNSDMSIEAIATETGFSDEKYFMRVFRKVMGVTPTQYRQTYFRMHTNTK